MSVRYVTHGSASPNSFFTHTHRLAAGIAGHQMVSGVYSRDAAKSAQYGNDFGSIGTATIGEAIKAANDPKYGLVTLPNVGHFQAAKDLLLAGLPVLCEKPFTMTVPQAEELKALAAERNIPLALAYTYQNFWATTLLAKLCARRADGTPGMLGAVTGFNGLYFQDWQLQDLAIEQEWRQDPAISGDFNCGGDILTHIEQLVRVLTGETVTGVIGSTQIVGPTLLQKEESKRQKPRKLDDNASAMVQLSNGAVGHLQASQVAAGRLNGCSYQIWFEYGMIEGNVEEPETVTLDIHGAPKLTITRGQTFLSSEDVDNLVTRDGSPYELPLFGKLDALTEAAGSIEVAPLPPGGHVAGFYTALATMHHRFALVVSEWEKGGKKTVPSDFYGLATIDDGVAGMHFLAKLKKSVTEGAPFVTEI